MTDTTPTTPVEVKQDPPVVAPTPDPNPQPESKPESKPESRPPPEPLKPWPYPSAQDVDLVYQDSKQLITLPKVLGVVVVGAFVSLWQSNPEFQQLVNDVLEVLKSNLGLVFLAANVLLLGYVYYKRFIRKTPVYLVDFACYEPPPELYVSTDYFKMHTRRVGFFNEESITFQDKLLTRTGLGEETSFPPGILANPPCMNMESARGEFDLVMKGALDELFAKTKVNPKDIGILIVNCSLFNPTPSMAARIINLYKMKSNIQSYNLSGMGCSASVIAVHLARDLLQTYPNQYALIFSTENITQNWYTGQDKGMLVSNTLFRVGGAGILLTNKKSSKNKLELIDTYRTHLAADEEAYRCVYQEEDAQGKKGVRLSQQLMKIAEKGLTLNLNHLGATILPIDEQLKYVWSMLKKKLGWTDKLYQPNFKKGIQHFCIHAGGRAIIDGLEKTLELEERHVAPSRATLYRYGNTSSSSIWYELRYIERSGVLVAGDVIWQIALGSGFKCNSGVWRSLKTVKNRKPKTVA